jgi:hypothetical protein
VQIPLSHLQLAVSSLANSFAKNVQICHKVFQCGTVPQYNYNSVTASELFAEKPVDTLFSNECTVGDQSLCEALLVLFLMF